jgi:glycosyltransferase involved in cell wall biosynthesis
VLLVDPKSEDELRNALSRLLDSPESRADLGRRGRVRAERFRWPECAARSLDFFRRI